MEKIAVLKKLCAAGYVLLITGACAVPFAGMLMGWGAKSSENRQLSGMPDLYTATEDAIDPNFNYTAELGQYYSDNFGFRQELVTADSWLGETLFGRASNQKVVIGREGWYYLAETTDDYTGASSLSERGIFRLKKTLDLMNRYAEGGNITFVFFAAPNKNSIYPEYMPGSVRRTSAPSNLDRLGQAMRGCVYYVDIKDVLRQYAAKEERPIYLRNDSHWNNLGALAAYNALQNNLRIRIKNYDYRPVDVSRLYISQTETRGDLTEMLYPSLRRTDVQYELGLPKNYATTSPLTNLMAPEINTTCQGRYYSLICYRDSFFNALIPIQSNAFARVRYSRTSKEASYDLTAAKSGGYNIAMVEIAERNLTDILYAAPLMDAPGVDRPEITRRRYAAQSCRFADDGEYFIIDGELGDWAELKDDGCIYIELRDGKNRSRFYEAFPIRTGNSRADNGFSARISKYNLTNGEYQFFIHAGNQKQTIFTELTLD